MNITKKTNKGVLERLQKKLDALNGQSVTIGWHNKWYKDANMPFASLAYMHAKADVFGLSFPKRDIFPFIKPVVGGSPTQNKFFGDLFTSYFKYQTSMNVDILFNNIGRQYMQKAKSVIGNSSYLPVTNNPTPLVDTGQLKSAIGYKTTIHYKVRYA